MVYIKDLHSGLKIFKALSSEIRIEILNLLAKYNSLYLNEIAEKLHLTNGAVTMHIKKLEESGLIEIITSPGKHGIQKVCYLCEDQLTVEFRPKAEENLYECQIKVGHYTNYHVEPTCGLATKESIIGEFDDPRYFADPQRINAGIIWFSEGFIEYRIPNYLKRNEIFKELQFIMELGSEAPSYNNNWPSDIYFYLNDIELGYWTSPGDFGDKIGKYNPHWWPHHLNQYGMLKLLRINEEGTFIDGCRISNVTMSDIGLNAKSNINFKLAVSSNQNGGGITIFGKDFGNYHQDIVVRVLYDVVNKS